MKREAVRNAWPGLPYSAWRGTYATLHLWMQIVGKIRLSLTPWLNHSWHVVLYVTARSVRLVDAIDLVFLTKQAPWNLKGPRCAPPLPYLTL